MYNHMDAYTHRDTRNAQTNFIASAPLLHAYIHATLVADFLQMKLETLHQIIKVFQKHVSELYLLTLLQDSCH